MQHAVVGFLGRDRRRSHHEPDLEVDVRNRRLDVVGAALGYDARGVARVGLLHVLHAEREALGLVGVEQRGPGLALDDRG